MGRADHRSAFEWGLVAIVAAVYVFIGWLNVRVGVGMLRSARAKIESMCPHE